MPPRHQPPGDAEGERRRHRDHGVGARRRPAGGQAGTPGEHGEPDEAEGPPRQVALVAAGERVHPGDAPPRRALAIADRHPPSRVDGVVAVPRQGGDDVQRVAARRQLVDDPRHHGAGGRRVRPEVRTHHHDPQPPPPRRSRISTSKIVQICTISRPRIGAGPPVGVVEGAARRRLRERRRAAQAPVDETGAVGGHRVEGVGPGIDRQAGARRRRRRRPRAGRRDRCTPPACRGPSPRAPARRSPRTPRGTPAPRPARSARRGRRPTPDPGAPHGGRHRRGRRPRSARRRPRRARPAARARGRDRPTARRAVRRGSRDACAGG